MSLRDELVHILMETCADGSSSTTSFGVMRMLQSYIATLSSVLDPALINVTFLRVKS